MDNTTTGRSDADTAVVKFEGNAVIFMLNVLYDIEDYLDNRAVVIDGDYGEPRPNREMTLLGEVRLAIRIAEKGK